MAEGKTLEVKGLSRIYARTGPSAGLGVKAVSFTLPPGTFFTLLGPSGCGKTTTLRCIAGLEQPDTGVLRSGEDVLFDAASGVNVPVNRRGFGMVFQSYAIWPHMSVFDNIAFPLRLGPGKVADGGEVRQRVDEALDAVGLGGFGKRSPTELSGGQQQRVALARAIVARPRVLLLDEPLSNLDARLREEMRAELQRLQRQLGLTTVYVTHDQSEALEMSDLIAVLDRGELVQLGSPREIYQEPANTFVATFVGKTNLIPAKTTIIADHAGVATARIGDGTALRCRLSRNLPPGTMVNLCIRPETIKVHKKAETIELLNRLPGVIEAATFQGPSLRLEIASGPLKLQAFAPASSRLGPGDTVHLVFAAEATLALEGKLTAGKTLTT